jgi:hypothetical protein
MIMYTWITVALHGGTPEREAGPMIDCSRVVKVMIIISPPYPEGTR